jgi:hypothetical protein
LLIAHSKIVLNSAQAGSGGAGGSAHDVGGPGGDSGSNNLGGGLYLDSQGQSADTWTLDSDLISQNALFFGSGGKGGSGIDGGNGGWSIGGFGAGVWDTFEGTLLILHCDITENQFFDALGGAGGSGAFAGSSGQDSTGNGGGIYVGGVAYATADTQIVGNSADLGPNVYGIYALGTI